MSAPNTDKPNEGILNKIGNTATNAANFVTEKAKGLSSEASKEAHKEEAKGNVEGQDSLGDRVSGAVHAVGDKMDEEKHKTSAEGEYLIILLSTIKFIFFFFQANIFFSSTQQPTSRAFKLINFLPQLPKSANFNVIRCLDLSLKN